MQFDLKRLTEYSDEQILTEIRRVAGIVTTLSLTQTEFAQHARVSKQTLKRRFGSWKDALIAAGLSSRYSGVVVTVKMRRQESKSLADDEVLERLKFVASKLGRDMITVKEFNDNSGIEANTVRLRFGSWKAGLSRAGLRPVSLGKRYTDEECYENLLTVWTHYGRPPRYLEMNKPPSIVGPKAYTVRWTTWSRALHAFVDRVGNESDVALDAPSDLPETSGRPTLTRKEEDNHAIRLGLRYKVLVRDKFKCQICGNSPAVDQTCRLHVDHTHPWSKGGKTIADNLRTLCEPCNLGKGNSLTEMLQD